jgi:hypothetical protein
MVGQCLYLACPSIVATGFTNFVVTLEIASRVNIKMYDPHRRVQWLADYLRQLLHDSVKGTDRCSGVRAVMAGSLAGKWFQIRNVCASVAIGDLSVCHINIIASAIGDGVPDQR